MATTDLRVGSITTIKVSTAIVEMDHQDGVSDSIGEEVFMVVVEHPWAAVPHHLLLQEEAMVVDLVVLRGEEDSFLLKETIDLWDAVGVIRWGGALIKDVDSIQVEDLIRDEGEVGFLRLLLEIWVEGECLRRLHPGITQETGFRRHQ